MLYWIEIWFCRFQIFHKSTISTGSMVGFDSRSRDLVFLLFKIADNGSRGIASLLFDTLKAYFMLSAVYF